MNRNLLVSAFIAVLAGSSLVVGGVGTAAAACDRPVITSLDVAAREDHAVLQAGIDCLPKGSAWDLYFEYRRPDADTWKTSDHIRPDENAVNEIKVENLREGTKYEFRAVLARGRVAYRSETMTFTTDGTPPKDDGGGSDGGIIAVLTKILNHFQKVPQEVSKAIRDLLLSVATAVVNAVTAILIGLITNFPTIWPNEDVALLHRRVLTASLLLTGVSIMVVGLLHILNFVNISQPPVRYWLGRILLAAVLGAFSPQLVQLLVDGSHAATVAFTPQNPTAASQFLLQTELLLIAYFNAFFVVALGLLFVIRDVYMLFFAVAAPLIFLMAATPYLRRYAQSLIGVFVGFLLVGPLDMIVLHLTLSLLEHDGGNARILLGLGGIILMLGIAFIVLNAGMTMVGIAAGTLAGATRRGTRKVRNGVDRKNSSPTQQQRGNGRERRDYRQSTGGGNRFDKETILNDVNNDR